MQFFNVKASDFPAAIAAIEEKAGYRFSESSHLVSALTHSSYSAEYPNHPHPCNERLEFLGDAVLQLIVSVALMREFPDNPEGDLTRFRSMLVDEVANAGYARMLGLPKAMLMGRGECLTGGRERQSIQGDLFEAFLGAVYKDGGFEAAQGVVERLVPNVREAVMTMAPARNPKGSLNNYVQEAEHDTPKYVETAHTGPDHSPVFEYSVLVRGEVVGHGRGSTKHRAEEEAALAALRHFKLLPPAEEAEVEEADKANGKAEGVTD